MSDEPGWCLVFAFPNQAPDFAFGFSCGRLWERMNTTDDLAIGGMFPSETRETIEAMAMSRGWVEEIEDVADGWISVSLTKPDDGGRGAEPALPIVPHIPSGVTP